MLYGVALRGEKTWIIDRLQRPIFVNKTHPTGCTRRARLCITPGTSSVSVTPISGLNVDVPGTISELGESDVWIFTGSIGQQFVAAVVDLAGTNVSLRLISPSATIGTPLYGNARKRFVVQRHFV